MNLTKKILQIFALIFLALYVASCDEGCVEADEFDVQSLLIESKPENLIYGTYDPITGGQRSDWQTPGFRSNGDRFLMQISGQWAPLEGETMNDAAVRALPRCNFCAKRSGMPSMNCMCYQGQTPSPERDPAGNLKNVDCTITANKNDPTQCTCTNDPQYGTVTDYGIYHFPLNILRKDETTKEADYQTNCRYDRGMGAYISLQGPRGVTVPIRAYHLFSQEEICNIVRNSQGQCLDDNGIDITRYVYRSANSRIFMKDDNDGNDNIDPNTGNDVYHGPNEHIKTLMYDSYYRDNYGKYNVRILRGVGNENEQGLLEYLVSIVEDSILGEVGDDGVRRNGIIEFMYKSIVQDSGFILVLQISLSLYIALFGAAHLFGVVELNKKELMTRALKIGLIMFFTSRDSWYFYNKIVVAFFKDSMDYLVSMIMDYNDSFIDSSSLISIAQMDRAEDYSSATRFSYVDLVIKKLFSLAVAKKIFGLFFNSIFGFLYIPMIYGLIAYFVYVMLLIASMYVVNVIKIAFVLSLGPIFMCLTLFSQTAGMFRNWLGFLGGRTLEIIILFTVLYMFLTIIDKNFNDLLLYRSCGENRGIGPAKLIILMSYVDRSFLDWMIRFISIGGLIFMTKLVIDKVPELTKSLFSINIGGGKSGSGESSAKLAGSMVSAVFGLGKSAAGTLGGAGATMGRLGIRGMTLAARKSGLADKVNAIGQSIPIRGPRTLYRDSIIDGAIKRAQSAANASGQTGAKRDALVRAETMKILQQELYDNPNKMALAGVDMTTIGKRMDQKLIEEPLKKFLKDEAKKLKGAENPLLGKAMRNQLRTNALEFAKKNFAAGVDGAPEVERLLQGSKMREFVRDNAEMSSKEAARAFADNKEGQNRFFQHLKDNQARSKRKQEQAAKSIISRIPNAMGRLYHNIRRDAAHNPNFVARNFAGRVNAIENDRGFVYRGLNMWRFAGSTDERAQEGRQLALRAQLQGDKGRTYEPAKAKSRKELRDMRKEYRNRGIFESQLRDMVTRDLQKDMKAIRALEKKDQMVAASALKSQLLQKLQKEKDAFIRGDDARSGLGGAVSGVAARGTAASPASAGAKGGVGAAAASGARSGAVEISSSAGSGAELGRTAFEFAARLSYVHQQLGVAGELPIEHLARLARERTEDKADQMRAEMAAGNMENVIALRAELEKTDFHGPKVDRDQVARDLESSLKAIDDRLAMHGTSSTKPFEDAAVQAGLAKEEAKTREKIAEVDKEILVHTQAALQKVTEVEEKVTKVVAEAAQAIEKAKAAGATPDEIKALPEVVAANAEVKAASGLVATEFKVEFGSSITDALLKPADIGLKASNITLGVAAGKEGKVDPAVINLLKVNMNQMNGKYKMKNLDLKMKQFEYDKRKAGGETEADLLSLSKEITELEREVKDAENEAGRIEAEIKKFEAM